MLKIKNYIFNENEIVYINEYDAESLGIMLKGKDKCILVDEHIEDIEWNYDTDMYCKVMTKIQNRNKELEEENKKFDVIKQLLKQEEKIYGSLTDAGKMILKIIDGEE